MRGLSCGTHIKVSFWFFAALAAAVYLGGDVALVLLAALLHEAGHAAAILWSGGRIERVELRAFSARIQPRYQRVGSLRREAAVLAAGPAAGLLAAGLAAALGSWRFCMVNIALSAFNLLPMRGLDGGSLLRTVCARFDSRTADRVETAAQILTPGILAALASRRLWGPAPAFAAAAVVVCMAAALLTRRER